MIDVSMVSLPARALIFATKAHGAQRRKYTNDPYIVHPIAVADRVRRALMIDGDSILIVEAAQAAAYMHDVLEDTSVTTADMRAEFGDRITEWVLEVTDVSKPGDGNRARREEIDREHLSRAGYVGASIKLADLIDNTSTIVKFDPDFAKVYMKEKAMAVPLLGRGNRWLYKEANELLEDYFAGRMK